MAAEIERRTIIKGAAWSVPAVALAVAAPAAAASGPCANPQTYSSGQPGGAEDSVISGGWVRTFTVPAGVTVLTYSVRGGRGGDRRDLPLTGVWQLGASPGHDTSAATVTGTIPVTPGETLNLVIGQGGFSTGTAAWTPGVGTVLSRGGGGYGDGGDATATFTRAGARSGGASGGGGSAILRGGVPLVVAGGGGGASKNLHEVVNTFDGQGNPIDLSTEPFSTVKWNATSFPLLEAAGGSPAFADIARANSGAHGNVGTPGAGGAVPTPAYDNVLPFYGVNTAAGNAGSASGKGGDAVIVPGGSPFTGQDTEFNLHIGSGAGGGGYTGGGSGSSTMLALGDPTFTADATRLFTINGAGGRGASYIAPGVTGTISLPDLPFPWSEDRWGGIITLAWC